MTFVIPRNFSLAIFIVIQVYVLLLDKLLQFLDLFAVQVNAHFVCSSNQIWMYLHLQLSVVIPILVFVIFLAVVFLLLFHTVAHVIFFIVGSTVLFVSN